MRRAIIREGRFDSLFSTPRGAARLGLVAVVVVGLMAAGCGGGPETAGEGSGTAPPEPELTGGRFAGSYEVVWETTSFRFKGKPSGEWFGPDSSGMERWTISCDDSTCSFQSDALGERTLVRLLKDFKIKELELGSDGVSQEGKTVERCGQELPGVARLKKVVTTAKLDLRGTDPQMVDGEPVFTQLSGTVTIDPSELKVKMKSPLGFTLTCKYSGLEAAVSGTRVP